ncbi:MAG TPA: HXXEE domain-containing protein [Bryobacteraceae bacterium]|nr:HXXEE domain-containing protein [Bryobacteraceae bacterium]
MKLLEIKNHLFSSVYPERRRFIAWLLLCAALAAHIGEEAATGFLELWNPEVASLGFPALRFHFPVWITLLALAVAGLLILSYWVRRGTWWTPAAAYIFILLMLSNGIAHLAFSFHRREMMPGAYTSPLLIAASIFLWTTLRPITADSS